MSRPLCRPSCCGRVSAQASRSTPRKSHDPTPSTAAGIEMAEYFLSIRVFNLVVRRGMGIGCDQATHANRAILDLRARFRIFDLRLAYLSCRSYYDGPASIFFTSSARSMSSSIEISIVSSAAGTFDACGGLSAFEEVETVGLRKSSSGLSKVMIFRARDQLISSIIAASVVDLPDPSNLKR